MCKGRADVADLPRVERSEEGDNLVGNHGLDGRVEGGIGRYYDVEEREVGVRVDCGI